MAENDKNIDSLLRVRLTLQLLFRSLSIVPSILNQLKSFLLYLLFLPFQVFGQKMVVAAADVCVCFNSNAADPVLIISNRYLIGLNLIR